MLWQIKSKKYSDKQKKDSEYETLLIKHREYYKEGTKVELKKKLNAFLFAGSSFAAHCCQDQRYCSIHYRSQTQTEYCTIILIFFFFGGGGGGWGEGNRQTVKKFYDNTKWSYLSGHNFLTPLGAHSDRPRTPTFSVIRLFPEKRPTPPVGSRTWSNNCNCIELT